jgi:hypothetical protein
METADKKTTFVAALLASAAAAPSTAEAQSCGQCPPMSIVRNIGPFDFKVVGTYLYQAHIPADGEYGLRTSGTTVAPSLYVDFFRSSTSSENIQVCRRSYSGTTINCNTNLYHESTNAAQDVFVNLSGVYSINNSVWDHYMISVQANNNDITFIGGGCTLADWS